MVHQAREFSMAAGDGDPRIRFLIHDRDSKFSASFDEVFSADRAKVIKTPVRAPDANAYAERWVRTVREECLDWMLIWGRRHLVQVLHVYIEHYNRERPHRSLDLRPPWACGDKGSSGRRDNVNPSQGSSWRAVHEYYQVDIAA
jgi:putative transposase